MRKRTIAVASIIVMVASVATASFFFQVEDGEIIFKPPISTPGEPTFDYLKGATVIPFQPQASSYNEITGDYRPEYPISPEEYSYLFGNLPTFPEDFFGIVTLVYEGKVTDYTRLSEHYWKQPEFFSGWYASFNASYMHHNPTMWSPEGYGMFPLIKEVTAPSGTTVTVSGFMRTGFGTESYQGVIFHPSIPEKALSINGKTIFEQPENAKQYLKPKIITPDNEIFESFKDNIETNNVGEEDWFVILKPTLQRIRKGNSSILLGFPEDWIRQFDIEIEIAKDTPKDMYCIAVNPESPCFHINQEFYLSHEHEYYGKQYFPGGNILRSEVPHFQIILEVM